MAITIIAVGKKHESWVLDGIERYEKRLKRPFDIGWHLLPHSRLEGQRARQEESERILSRLKVDDFIVLLDEKGGMFDSSAISHALLAPLQQSKRIVVIIGGAYGVDASVQRQANVVWSLSKLVFPHQLVRLLLVEQLYRAQEIASGGPYHHE